MFKGHDEIFLISSRRFQLISTCNAQKQPPSSCCRESSSKEHSIQNNRWDLEEHHTRCAADYWLVFAWTARNTHRSTGRVHKSVRVWTLRDTDGHSDAGTQAPQRDGRSPGCCRRRLCGLRQLPHLCSAQDFLIFSRWETLQAIKLSCRSRRVCASMVKVK